MGGYGSGRRWQTAVKATTDNYPALDIRELRRVGLLNFDRVLRYEWSCEGQKLLTALLRANNSHVEVYPIAKYENCTEEIKSPQLALLSLTPCNYGGTRTWFCCPQCSRRVAVLYIAERLACRHCLQLQYKSQREVYFFRAVRRAKKLDLRLGGTGVMGMVPVKPKGMWWRTYQRLANDYCSMKRKALLGISAKLDIEV